MREAVRTLYDTYLKKTPRQSRSRSVVEAILAAALQRVEHTGDENDVTVQEVAERAGVGIGSLYDYFRDRRSLLAGVAAKVTEDNLVAFERVLSESRDAPLRTSIERLVDHAFATYLGDRRMPRALLRVAHSVGLMPTIAATQDAFSEALAAFLRSRDDVRVDDVEVASFVVTNAVMGVVHTLIWQDAARFERARLRDAVVDSVHAYLAAT